MKHDDTIFPWKGLDWNAMWDKVILYDTFKISFSKQSRTKRPCFCVSDGWMNPEKKDLWFYYIPGTSITVYHDD